MARHQPMSMEAMLDEERKEVLALLEGNSNPRPRPPSALGSRSPSPYTPRSPVRSMLDIGDDPPSPTLPAPVSPGSSSTKTTASETAPVRSMLDVDSRPTPQVRSMLDVDSPPSAAKQVLSTPSSPTDPNIRAHAAHNAHPRSMSDASARPPADFGPRLGPLRADKTSEYQFSGIITTHGGQALPKRVTQGGKRSNNNAMAEVMKGNDVTGLVLPGDRGRHHSASGPPARPGNKSKSPQSRLGIRSKSPRSAPLLRNLSPAGRAVVNDPEIVDYNNAYRRLSDAALARSAGTLSDLGRRRSANYMSGTGRLAKDYLGPDGELLVEDSSEDDGSSSGEEGQRGRKAARNFEKSPGGPESPDSERQAKSLLGAAEAERKSWAKLADVGIGLLTACNRSPSGFSAACIPVQVLTGRARNHSDESVGRACEAQQKCHTPNHQLRRSAWERDPHAHGLGHRAGSDRHQEGAEAVVRHDADHGHA